MLFFIMTIPIHILNNSVQGFSFLHILTNICHLLSKIDILTDMKWYLITVLIYIPLMTSDVQYLLTYLGTIHTPFLKNVWFTSFAHFLIGACILFLLLSYSSSLYTFGYETLIRYIIGKHFFCYVDCLFIFSVCYAEASFIFAFFGLCFWRHVHEVINKTSVTFYLEFYAFRAYIQVFNLFWIIFCDCCKIGVQFHSFAYRHPVFLAQFLEQTMTFLLGVLGVFVKGWLTNICVSLSLGFLFCWIGLYAYFYANTILF